MLNDQVIHTAPAYGNGFQFATDPPIIRAQKLRDVAIVDHLLTGDDSAMCYAILADLDCDFDREDEPLKPVRIIGVDFTAKSNWQVQGSHMLTQFTPSQHAYWIGVASRLVADLHEVEVMRIRDKVRGQVALVGN
jgi:hypothetical protein